MKTITHQIQDATSIISLVLNTTNDAHIFDLSFISNKITKVKKTIDFDAQFQMPKDDNFTENNVYLAVVNYLLHYLYDGMAMMDVEEMEFCEINCGLEDNLKAWEQGQIYINAKDKLFHRAPIGYSATDIIRITEGKLRNMISLIFKDME